MFEVPLALRRSTRATTAARATGAAPLTRHLLCAALPGPLHLGCDRRHPGQLLRPAEGLRRCCAILLQYLLPLLLPFLVYLVYARLARGAAGLAASAPWLAPGRRRASVLLAVSLVAWGLLAGSDPGETYVPPRIEDGRDRPGHDAGPEADGPGPRVLWPASPG